MDFKEIDALFEGALQRLTAKANPAAAYGEPPLASDHFLLKRGWEYFRDRAAAMEAEWKQLVSAKEDEIRALREIIRLRDEKLSALEAQARDTDDVEEAFARARLAEERDFSDATRKLHDTWEEERGVLLRSVEEANARVQQVRAEAEHRLKAAHKEVAELRVSLEKARVELAAQADKRLSAEGELTRALSARDEVIRSMETKLDLMRSELDRRDLALKDVQGEAAALARERDELAQRALRDAAELGARDERLRFLEEKLAAARAEMESLRSSWSREQAEWRELWERSRDMWERARKKDDLPSGNQEKEPS